MYCKFLVFLLIVFFFFSLFSSACEFRFVERMCAHGKQNPDFITDLRQEVYVFAGVYLFVCLFVCLCVQHNSKSYG